MLHRNESQEATSVAAAKAIYSQSVLEAKTNFQAAVMEAKTNRGHSIQEAKVACSKAITEARAQKTSQAVMLHKEHGKYMQGLEEQAFREESRSCHDILSSCQATLSHSPQLLRGTLATSYHLLLGQALPLPPPILPPKDSPCGITAIHSHSSHTNAQTVSKTKKVTSFARANGEHAYGQSHPDGHAGSTSQPQEARDPSLVQVP